MEEKREYLVKGRILEKQFSRTYRFLILLILFILSLIIKCAENIFFLRIYHDIFEPFDKLKSIFSTIRIIGIILGNFLFIIISQIENRKKVTFICFLLNGILYFIFGVIETKYFFTIFFIGIFKNYKDIFIPVWIEQFCIKKYKTIFMYIYLTNIIGYILELWIIFIIDSNEWHVFVIKFRIFGVFGVLVIIFDCLLLFFPNKYFSFKYNFIGYKVKGKEEFTKIENFGQSSFFENQEDNNINNNEIEFLKTIINNRIYVFSILSNICYLFVYQYLYINIFQRFILIDNDDYLIKISKICGSIFGGIYLLSIGGYEKKESSIFLCLFLYISFFFLLIIDSIKIFKFYFFLFFFFSFSDTLLIINKCFIVNCIPNKYKGPGVALSLFLENIIKLVGPYFLKFLDKSFDNSFLPKIIHLILYILSIKFYLYSSFYRYRNVENVNEINNDKEKELEDIEKM